MPEFKTRLRRRLPAAHTLEETRGFAWLSHYLHEHPRLWVLHRRGVALDIGVGVFPVPLQVPVAMIAAVALRVNVAARALVCWGWTVMIWRERGRRESRRRIGNDSLRG
jgi:uncharacterized protein (DUF2062 family)